MKSKEHREHKNAVARARHAANPEKYREIFRQQFATLQKDPRRRAKRRATGRLWEQAHPQGKKAYREKNVKQIREKDREYYRGHRDKWVQLNETVKRRTREDPVFKQHLLMLKGNWARAHPEGNRAKMKRYRQELRDSYIKTLLIDKSTLTRQDLPQVLIEEKRAYLKLRRMLNEISH